MAAVLLPWLLVWANSAANDIHTIELKYRHAEQVLPVLRPMLAPGETVSGQDRVLALRAAPDTVAQLRALIARLDRAPHNLQITVRLTSGGAGERPSQELRRIQTHDRAPRVHRVRVSEGQPVSIFTRSRQADVGLDVLVAAYPIVVRTRSDDRPVESGFAAVAYMVDDKVLLDLYTLNETAAGWRPAGPVASSELATRVRTNPGEWLELSRVYAPPALESQRARRTLRTGNRGTAIAVKVERLD